MAVTLRRLNEALDTSPTPACEWAGVNGVLGGEVLASLLGISPSSVRRYLSGSRATPDAIAARVHFLAVVIGDLAGAYNEFGVRRWFQRPRRLLGTRSPAQLLEGSWQPEDPGPQRVRDLAAATVGGRPGQGASAPHPALLTPDQARFAPPVSRSASTAWRAVGAGLS